MSTTTKPHLILVPGSFTEVTAYQLFGDHLRFLGYTFEAVPLQSAGRRAPPLGPATVSEDAEAIAAVVRSHCDAGKEVVLLTHSYGGIPGTESLKGLSVKERSANGEKGGVARIVYLTSIVALVGKSAQDEFGQKIESEDNLSFIQMGEDGYMSLDLIPVCEANFNLLPAVERPEQGRLFTVHSAASFGSPVTHAGYLDVPVTYFLCTEDLVLKPDFQRKTIEGLEEAGAQVNVVEVPGDHCWCISMPRYIAKRMVEVVSGGASN